MRLFTLPDTSTIGLETLCNHLETLCNRRAGLLTIRNTFGIGWEWSFTYPEVSFTGRDRLGNVFREIRYPIEGIDNPAGLLMNVLG
ncbi:hypothetical protein ASG22_03450 [Chryseobacterium sp. Leaf405]|nr:hypothetical protein ASG22_03450 [Chryseobacterium sp. Leaf405]